MELNIAATIANLTAYKEARKHWWTEIRTDLHKDKQVDDCVALLKNLEANLVAPTKESKTESKTAESKVDSRQDTDAYLNFMRGINALIKAELNFEAPADLSWYKLLGKFLDIQIQVMLGFLGRKQFDAYREGYFILDDLTWSKEAERFGIRGCENRRFIDYIPTCLRMYLANRAIEDLEQSLVDRESKGAAKDDRSSGIDYAGAQCYARIAGIVARNGRDPENCKAFLTFLNRITALGKAKKMEFDGRALSSPLSDMYARMRGVDKSIFIGPQAEFKREVREGLKRMEKRKPIDVPGL